MSENKTFTRFEKSQIMNTAKVLKNFIAKKATLQKKISELNEEIAAIDESQRRWEGPIMDLLQGHRIEDVIEYQRELQASGKYSTKIVFRYPDSILPPEEKLEDETYSAPSRPGAGSDYDIDREPDIDTDMPGHWEKLPSEESVPEYDSAGFGQDGLQEGEPAELAEKVENPDDDDPFALD